MGLRSLELRVAILHVFKSSMSTLCFRSRGYNRPLGDCRNQLRDIYANSRSFALLAGNIHLEIAPIEDAQTLMDVADSDTVAEDLRHAVLGDADTVVFDFDH